MRDQRALQEYFPQAPARIRQSAFRRAERDFQPPGYLAVGMSEHVVQDEHPALIGWQLPKRRPDLEFVVERRAADPWRREPGLQLLPPPAPAAVIDRRVDDNPVEPGERRRIASKCVPPAKRVEERVLHDVLGFVADVARRNGTQLPLGVLVRVHDRVVQGLPLKSA